MSVVGSASLSSTSSHLCFPVVDDIRSMRDKGEEDSVRQESRDGYDSSVPVSVASANGAESSRWVEGIADGPVGPAGAIGGATTMEGVWFAKDETAVFSTSAKFDNTFITRSCSDVEGGTGM